jgi:hypothetical protein
LGAPDTIVSTHLYNRFSTSATVVAWTCQRTIHRHRDGSNSRNIFFRPLKEPGFQYPPDWKEIEDNRDDIKAYLKERPTTAEVVLNEKSTWQSYDGQVITPTFYLIDKEGVVRFSAYGSSPELIRIIDKMIEGLRSK